MTSDPARRKFVLGAALLAAQGLLPAAARAQAPIATARIVQSTTAIEQSLAWIAAEAGIYGALGLNVQFVPGATGATAALGRLADAHLAYSGVAQVAERFLQGGDAVIIATVLEPNRGGMLMAASEIRSPSDLANRRIGVLGGGATAAAVEAILERARVRAELVALGTYEAVFAALTAGRVQAGWLPIELAFKGRAASGWNAFEGARLVVPGGYVTTRRAIAAQRGVIETLVQGLVAAIHYFKADAAGTTRLLERRLGVERAVAADLQAFYAPLLRPAPQPTIFYGLAGLRHALQPRHPAAERMQAADLVDASFVEAMVRDGTIAKLYQTR